MVDHARLDRMLSNLIANHIIASERYRVPRDFADSFDVLVEQDILGEEKRDNLRAMARFRNRLVHLYSEVEDSRVYDYLQESLADLDDYARAIAGHEWDMG
ncbi:MAG: type VII toxin-antitoxin system HepT family RNase toxin [Thermoanaerobaculia bacterium]